MGLGGCDGRLICPAAEQRSQQTKHAMERFLQERKKEKKKDAAGQPSCLERCSFWLCGRVSCFWWMVVQSNGSLRFSRFVLQTFSLTTFFLFSIFLFFIFFCLVFPSPLFRFFPLLSCSCLHTCYSGSFHFLFSFLYDIPGVFH